MKIDAITKPGRALWKGYLKLSLVSCAVALYKATTSVERVSFNKLNPKTGNRLRQRMVDGVTGETVEDWSRGYEVGKNQYVMIDDVDLEAIQPPGDKVIDLDQFVRPGEIEPAFLDEHYYLVPDDPVAEQAFAIIHAALSKKNMVGIGKIVLRSRQRPIMLASLGKGLIGTTLKHTNEVRPAESIFAGIRDVDVPKEMLEIAMLLIERKTGKFDPTAQVDEFEQAVIELIKAKQAGTTFKPKVEATPRNVVNLMDAFKASLAETKPAAPSKAREGKPQKIAAAVKKPAIKGGKK